MSRTKILVPVDIHEDSSDVLQFAGSLAAAIRARISFVTVMNEVSGSDEPDKVLLHRRRKVELELSKVVNRNFEQGKPEFDIIVTRGDYAQRILQMSHDLSIDLMVLKASKLEVLSPMLSQLALVLIVSPLSTPLKQLALPVNLDTPYYSKLQDSIKIAQLLNTNLKIISYACQTMGENKYKEQLYDIKNMVERENVACVTSFNEWNPESGSFLEDFCLKLDGELPLLTLKDIEELDVVAGLPELMQANNTVIIPIKKRYLPKAPLVKQPQYYNYT